MTFDISFLNIAFSLEIGVFGITITIFTVLYSFILSKKGELTSLTEIHKTQDYSPVIEAKISFVRSYLKKIARINMYLFILAVSTFFLSVFSYIFIILSINGVIIPCIALCLLFFLCIISLIYILILLAFIARQYYIDTKIQ